MDMNQQTSLMCFVTAMMEKDEKLLDKNIFGYAALECANNNMSSNILTLSWFNNT
jgi:hypothetical protein